jgi:sporulation protein YlmC with PRC-barrel domain
MPVNVKDPTELSGATVLGHDGSKLGKVEDIYLDN